MARDEDLDLLQGCLAGRPGAWEAFVAAFAPYLATVCRRALARAGLPAGPSEAEDLLQEVFLALWADDRKVLRAYRGQAGVAGYLAAVAVHRVAREAARPLPPSAEPVSDTTDPAEALEAAEAASLLRAEISRLPSEARLALALRAEGAGLREIGRALGTSKDAAARLLAQARVTLQGRLKEKS